jgi:hypothetical protein
LPRPRGSAAVRRDVGNRKSSRGVRDPDSLFPRGYIAAGPRLP